MFALRALVCGGTLGFILAGPAVAGDEPSLSGTWVWSWDDSTGRTHRHVLEVEGSGASLAARERFDDQAPVKAAEFQRDGKNVRLTVMRGDQRAQYRGVVSDSDTINGTVTIKEGDRMNEFPWKARRQPKAP